MIGIIIGILGRHVDAKEDINLAVLSEMVATLFSTFGSTLLSIAIINTIYQQWRDAESKAKSASIIDTINSQIQAIPDSVKSKIEISIKEISTKVANEINPNIPCYIYDQGYTDDLKNALIKSLNESDGKYYYTGIGMSTMAKIIESFIYTKGQKKKTIEAYFLIPNPSMVSIEERKGMLLSINHLIKAWKSAKGDIGLEFVLLNYIPSFHIHKTNNNCWFAFVDQESVRDKYPVTYQYKLYNTKTKDCHEMYHTIASTIETLYENHKETISYIFHKKAGAKNSKTRWPSITKINGDDRTIKEENCKEFLSLFENESEA